LIRSFFVRSSNLSRIYINSLPMILRSHSINISIRNVLDPGTREPPTWKEPAPWGQFAGQCLCIFVPSFVQRKEHHEKRDREDAEGPPASRLSESISWWRLGNPLASSNRASSPVHPSFLVVFPSHLFRYPHRSRTSLFTTIILCSRRL